MPRSGGSNQIFQGGAWQKFVDALSVPNYAIGGAMDAVSSGNNVLEGVKRGVLNRTEPTDVMIDNGVPGPLAAGLGLGISIAADAPSMVMLPLGALTKGKHAARAMGALSRLSSGAPMVPLQTVLDEGLEFTGIAGRQLDLAAAHMAVARQAAGLDAANEVHSLFGLANKQRAGTGVAAELDAMGAAAQKAAINETAPQALAELQTSSKASGWWTRGGKGIGAAFEDIRSVLFRSVGKDLRTRTDRFGSAGPLLADRLEAEELIKQRLLSEAQFEAGGIVQEFYSISRNKKGLDAYWWDYLHGAVGRGAPKHGLNATEATRVADLIDTRYKPFMDQAGDLLEGSGITTVIDSASDAFAELTSAEQTLIRRLMLAPPTAQQGLINQAVQSMSPQAGALLMGAVSKGWHIDKAGNVLKPFSKVDAGFAPGYLLEKHATTGMLPNEVEFVVDEVFKRLQAGKQESLRSLANDMGLRPSLNQQQSLGATAIPGLAMSQGINTRSVLVQGQAGVTREAAKALVDGLMKDIVAAPNHVKHQFQHQRSAWSQVARTTRPELFERNFGKVMSKYTEDFVERTVQAHVWGAQDELLDAAGEAIKLQGGDAVRFNQIAGLIKGESQGNMPLLLRIINGATTIKFLGPKTALLQSTSIANSDAMNGVQNTRAALAFALKSPVETKRIMQRLGALLPSSHNVHETATLDKASYFWTQLMGIGAADQSARAVGGMASATRVFEIAETFHKLKGKKLQSALHDLQALGLDVAQLSQHSGPGQMSAFLDANPQLVEMALINGANRTNFASSLSSTPLAFHTPAGRFFLKFKSYAVQHSEFIGKLINKGKATGDYSGILRYAAGFPLAYGIVYKHLLAMQSKKADPDDSWTEIQRMLMTGALGYWGDVMMTAMSGSEALTLGIIAGPNAKALAETVSAPVQAIRHQDPSKLEGLVPQAFKQISAFSSR